MEETAHNDNPALRIIPLGGLGEIGLNMALFEYGDDIIVVDCGLMFPEPYMLGIDLVIPDISYLRDKVDRVRGIFLTHGHEDHIGALPFVLQELSPHLRHGPHPRLRPGEAEGVRPPPGDRHAGGAAAGKGSGRTL